MRYRERACVKVFSKDRCLHICNCDKFCTKVDLHLVIKKGNLKMNNLSDVEQILNNNDKNFIKNKEKVEDDVALETPACSNETNDDKDGHENNDSMLNRFQVIWSYHDVVTLLNKQFLESYGSDPKESFEKFFNNPNDEHKNVSEEMKNDILSIKGMTLEKAIVRLIFSHSYYNFIDENFSYFGRGCEHLYYFLSHTMDYDIQLIEVVRKYTGPCI